MNKPLYDFFTNDHHRVEGFLDKATEKPGEINMEYYHQFRTGLLKHIKMEENILFPAAQKLTTGYSFHCRQNFVWTMALLLCFWLFDQLLMLSRYCATYWNCMTNWKKNPVECMMFANN